MIRFLTVIRYEDDLVRYLVDYSIELSTWYRTEKYISSVYFLRRHDFITTDQALDLLYRFLIFDVLKANPELYIRSTCCKHKKVQLNQTECTLSCYRFVDGFEQEAKVK